MKLLFASDIHGFGFWCEKLEQRIWEEKPDCIVGGLALSRPTQQLTKRIRL